MDQELPGAEDFRVLISRDNGKVMLTYQEMFDKAVAGLAFQGWTRCSGKDGFCKYTIGNVHCAWGWVDPEGTATNPPGGVGLLRRLGCGLARQLDQEGTEFATALQKAHDGSTSTDDMKKRLIGVARRWGLTVPVVLGTKE